MCGAKNVHFMFFFGYVPRMRNNERHTPIIRDRDGLLQLIAKAVRLQLTYISRQDSLAVADTVLRSFKAAGLSIRRKKASR
jgi:hypothetical protein